MRRSRRSEALLLGLFVPVGIVSLVLLAVGQGVGMAVVSAIIIVGAASIGAVLGRRRVNRRLRSK
jgi:hypothetical protein